MVVQKSPNEGFLQFETLTLIPFDSRLIQLSLLTEAERSWLNAYHHRVYEGLFSFLKIEVQKWLKKATLPL
jgi:Xaa-Pro aminopeptidase